MICSFVIGKIQNPDHLTNKANLYGFGMVIKKMAAINFQKLDRSYDVFCVFLVLGLLHTFFICIKKYLETVV